MLLRQLNQILYTISVLKPSRFNRTLMNQRGTALGSEFRGKGVNVALGPMMLGLIFDNGN